MIRKWPRKRQCVLPGQKLRFLLLPVLHIRCVRGCTADPGPEGCSSPSPSSPDSHFPKTTGFAETQPQPSSPSNSRFIPEDSARLVAAPATTASPRSLLRPRPNGGGGRRKQPAARAGDSRFRRPRGFRSLPPPAAIVSRGLSVYVPDPKEAPTPSQSLDDDTD